MFAIIVLSVVVLTGWAGQVSLGQMAFVGVGGAVGAVVTAEWHADLSLALLVAGLAGAAVAMVVGLPGTAARGPVPGRHHPGVRPRLVGVPASTASR